MSKIDSSSHDNETINRCIDGHLPTEKSSLLNSCSNRNPDLKTKYAFLHTRPKQTNSNKKQGILRPVILDDEFSENRKPKKRDDSLTISHRKCKQSKMKKSTELENSKNVEYKTMLPNPMSLNQSNVEKSTKFENTQNLQYKTMQHEKLNTGTNLPQEDSIEFKLANLQYQLECMKENNDSFVIHRKKSMENPKVSSTLAPQNSPNLNRQHNPKEVCINNVSPQFSEKTSFSKEKYIMQALFLKLKNLIDTAPLKKPKIQQTKFDKALLFEKVSNNLIHLYEELDPSCIKRTGGNIFDNKSTADHKRKDSYNIYKINMGTEIETIDDNKYHDFIIFENDKAISPKLQKSHKPTQRKTSRHVTENCHHSSMLENLYNTDLSEMLQNSIKPTIPVNPTKPQRNKNVPQHSVSNNRHKPKHIETSRGKTHESSKLEKANNSYKKSQFSIKSDRPRNHNKRKQSDIPQPSVSTILRPSFERILQPSFEDVSKQSENQSQDILLQQLKQTINNPFLETVSHSIQSNIPISSKENLHVTPTNISKLESQVQYRRPIQSDPKSMNKPVSLTRRSQSLPIKSNINRTLPCNTSKTINNKPKKTSSFSHSKPSVLKSLPNSQASLTATTSAKTSSLISNTKPSLKESTSNTKFSKNTSSLTNQTCDIRSDTLQTPTTDLTSPSQTSSPPKAINQRTMKPSLSESLINSCLATGNVLFGNQILPFKTEKTHQSRSHSRMRKIEKVKEPFDFSERKPSQFSFKITSNEISTNCGDSSNCIHVPPYSMNKKQLQDIKRKRPKRLYKSGANNTNISIGISHSVEQNVSAINRLSDKQNVSAINRLSADKQNVTAINRLSDEQNVSAINRLFDKKNVPATNRLSDKQNGSAINRHKQFFSAIDRPFDKQNVSAINRSSDKQNVSAIKRPSDKQLVSTNKNIENKYDYTTILSKSRENIKEIPKSNSECQSNMIDQRRNGLRSFKGKIRAHSLDLTGSREKSIKTSPTSSNIGKTNCKQTAVNRPKNPILSRSEICTQINRKLKEKEFRPMFYTSEKYTDTQTKQNKSSSFGNLFNKLFFPDKYKFSTAKPLSPRFKYGNLC